MSFKHFSLYNSRFSRTVLGVALTFSLGSLGMMTKAAQALEAKAPQPSNLTSGTYLYGEAAQPDQIGQGYALFKHHRGEVIGAFYYPQSEFYCFRGSLENGTLEAQSIGIGEPEVVDVQVKLANLHALPQVTANDQRILAQCEGVAIATNSRLGKH